MWRVYTPDRQCARGTRLEENILLNLGYTRRKYISEFVMSGRNDEVKSFPMALSDRLYRMWGGSRISSGISTRSSPGSDWKPTFRQPVISRFHAVRVDTEGSERRSDACLLQCRICRVLCPSFQHLHFGVMKRLRGIILHLKKST
jgi:hypothetical protein